MDNTFKIGDKFIVVSRQRDPYWREIGYHSIGWKGIITNINGYCKWLNEYSCGGSARIDKKRQDYPFDIKTIKKIPVKRISPYAYWLSVTFGKK